MSTDDSYRHLIKQQQTRYWQGDLPGSKVTSEDNADGSFTISTRPRSGSREPSITVTYAPTPIPEGLRRLLEFREELSERLEAAGFQVSD